MAIKVIVFDFDGTLVDSNGLKHQAYFELFPKDEFHGEIVREVLRDLAGQTRYLQLPAMARKAGRSDADELLARYEQTVTEGAGRCPEMPGAEGCLRRMAGKLPLYLLSVTPEDSLKKIVKFRGWTKYFTDIFGYPREKAATLREIAQRENVRRDEVLMVGDGAADAGAARAAQCGFFQAGEPAALANLLSFLNL